MKKTTLLIIATLILINAVHAQVPWSQPITTEFEITDVVPICDKENYVWKKWNSGSSSLEEWDSLTHCYETTGIPQICCPQGHTCGYTLDPTDDNYMKCIKTTTLINYCQDYTNKAECESDTEEVAANSIKAINDANTPQGVCEEDYKETNNTYCKRFSNCLCYWDDTEGCNAGVEYSKWYCDYPGNDPDPPTGEDGICILKKGTVTGDCEDDQFIRITYDRQWVGTGTPPLECNGSFTRSIPCPTKLIFFTITSLIIAIAIIITIYSLSHTKRGNKNEKNNSFTPLKP